jgi:hypothetical protein
MTLPPRVEEALNIVIQQLAELNDIAKNAKSSGDTRLGFERLFRWKERTVRLLSENIHPNEGKKLQDKKIYSFGTLGDPRDNFIESVHIHSRFLESLYEELEKHPECILDVPTPSNKKAKTVKALQPTSSVEQETLLSATSGKANWKAIESEFGINKKGFGRKINFITDHFKRTIIFRDVEQAFVLASLGFSKPAVILAGSVIEELLRLYLECKNISPISDTFDRYIRTCEQHGLLKDSVSRLSHSVRQFRNLVHLSEEKNKKHTLSKATAIGAVSSIFTIASDF